MKREEPIAPSMLALSGYLEGEWDKLMSAAAPAKAFFLFTRVVGLQEEITQGIPNWDFIIFYLYLTRQVS